MRRVFLCALSMAAMIGATPTLAENGEMRVAYGDLNLNTVYGAHAVLGRIHMAAVSFCDAAEKRVPSRRAAMIDECQKNMTAGAVKYLNAPLVTALNEHRLSIDDIVLANK